MVGMINRLVKFWHNGNQEYEGWIRDKVRIEEENRVGGVTAVSIDAYLIEVNSNERTVHIVKSDRIKSIVQ